MTRLIWGVKASLRAYVLGMPDGVIELSGGAIAEGDTIVFPGEGGLRFTGSATLSGHSGMMRVVIADPRLEESAAGWVLTIADDEAADGRLVFATLDGLADHPDGAVHGVGTTLTADGADLFFGPYRSGTPLDDPVIRP